MLKLYCDGISPHFPEADFTKNGWTVIATLKHAMNGTWFTLKGRNLGSSINQKTFSFTSTELNRDLEQWSNRTLKLNFGFFSHFSETPTFLPNGQMIKKVQFLENEYANTECVTDDNYNSYGSVDAAGKIVDVDDVELVDAYSGSRSFYWLYLSFYQLKNKV